MISVSVVLLAAVGFLCLHLLANALKPGLRSIPGPWIAKFTEFYRVFMVRRGHFSYELMDLHRQYGSIVRVGPNAVSLSDSRVVEEIYGLRHSYPKSDWVKSSQTLYQGKEVPALLTTQNVNVHLTLKKSIANAYSLSTVLGYEGAVEDTVRLFLRRLDEAFITTGAECPLDRWIQWYAYDVIGMITMGRPMGLLEEGKDVDNMLGGLKAETDYRAAAAQMPLIDWIFRKNPVARSLRAPTHKIMIRARKMLDERLTMPNEKMSSRRDFISRFLEAKEQHPETLNDRNMLGFVGSNLQAGSDTTAIALRTILYHMLKNKNVFFNMRKEIDESGLKHPIPFQQAFNDLPYTKAVVQEALRIHPPFALLLERQVPPGGLQLPDGKVLPSGTKVGMFGYTMHRDRDIFGADADSFNPDRWLQKDGESEDQCKERVKNMQFYDMSFSRGQRACIGKHVAELQIYKVIPAMVGLLDMDLVDPEKEWTVDQKFHSVQYDIDVTIKWRDGTSLKDMEAT